MGNILLVFLKDLLKDFSDQFFDAQEGVINNALNTTIETLVHNTFYIEESMGFENGIQFNWNVIMGFVMQFAVVLIIIKFLKKGFDTYVAWTDDPAADPIMLVTNFLKAIVIALSFPILYDLLCSIVEEFTNGLLETLNLGTVGVDIEDVFVNVVDSLGLMNTIIFLIAAVLLLVLYVKFLMRAGELFILRVGFPLACVGNIDANGGIFSGYVSKLFQTVLSVTVQVVLAKMSITLIMGNHPIWSIVFTILAIKSPNILREMIYTPGGGGGGIGQVYYAAQMIRGLMKK